MATVLEEKRNEIESAIENALKKMNCSKESDLCKFIPMDGYSMHHLSFRRMKLDCPSDLIALLEKHIVQEENPQAFPPKPRLPKTSSRNRKKMSLSLDKGHAKALLDLARQSGNEELISILSPCESLRDIQRDLIASIKEKRADKALWETYLLALEAE